MPKTSFKIARFLPFFLAKWLKKNSHSIINIMAFLAIICSGHLAFKCLELYNNTVFFFSQAKNKQKLHIVKKFFNHHNILCIKWIIVYFAHFKKTHFFTQNSFKFCFLYRSFAPRLQYKRANVYRQYIFANEKCFLHYSFCE